MLAFSKSKVLVLRRLLFANPSYAVHRHRFVPAGYVYANGGTYAGESGSAVGYLTAAPTGIKLAMA
jgi:hypothetical protein